MAWYKITKLAAFTESFRRWFGNSKVVDTFGQPLRVYKGIIGQPTDTIQRPSDFPSFDPQDNKPVSLAGFFTDSPQVAARFTFGKGSIYAVYLKIENPKVFDAQGKPNVYIPLRSNQIKSAIGNSGDYNPLNDKILASISVR